MKMFEVRDKVAIVTGGADGIGAAIVKEFLKEGAKFIAIVDIDNDTGTALEKALADKFGEDKVKFMKCDVTKEEDLQAVFDETLQQNGYIDIVVNNAGIANDFHHRREIEINFSALVASSLKALEIMRQDRGGKGGTIVNVASVSALALLAPTFFVYGATKAAVLHFTSSIGKEAYYSKTNVRTITMCFGATETVLKTKLKSFDPEITEKVIKYDPIQSAEEAAQGTVVAYKNGKSASVWLVWCKVEDITDRVEKAYEIMAADVFD